MGERKEYNKRERAGAQNSGLRVKRAEELAIQLAPHQGRQPKVPGAPNGLLHAAGAAATTGNILAKGFSLG